jgi:hypothetical protein
VARGEEQAATRGRGRGILALSDETKSTQEQAGPQTATDSRDGKKADRDVGHALRSVYSATVNEDIPSELLDLLGKLG